MTAATPNMILTDLSNRPRFGVKGRRAQEWLTALGYSLPEQPNSWETTTDAMHLRLGISEFLIEANSNSYSLDALMLAAKSVSSGVYWVPRADTAFEISGSAATDLLSEICMLDTTKQANNALFMTQIAGISAILIKLPNTPVPSYRIWCDGSYHHYMLETLSRIAKELGHVELLIGI
jgi:sarcosine oxidase subunit gamma